MMGSKTFFSAFIIFGILTFPAAGLEVEQGAVKLVLYEDFGRFNVIIGDRGGTVKPFAFFVQEDPRTTALEILVDNNIYIMGERAEFKEVTEKTATGARFIWTSPLLRVTEEFIFLTTADSPLTEGVKVFIKIENVSEEDHAIAVRYIFDTYLGEKANTHFITSTNASLAKEASFNPATGGSYWISPFIESNRGDGLLMLTDAKYATQPDSVIFANWKRLYESTWDYKMSSDLDFNFYPYSFNDSAVCQYYNQQTVKKKSAREIVLVLGNSSSYAVQKSTIVADKTTTTDKDANDKNKLPNINDRPPEDKNNIPATTKFSGSVTKPYNKSSYDLVYAEIARIDQFVLEIDAKITAGKPLSDAEAKKYKEFLAEIETNAVQK